MYGAKQSTPGLDEQKKRGSKTHRLGRCLGRQPNRAIAEPLPAGFNILIAYDVAIDAVLITSQQIAVCAWCEKLLCMLTTLAA